MEEDDSTESILDSSIGLFWDIAEGSSVLKKEIGGWTSCFFGSRKPSFAKMLGYTITPEK